MSDLIRVRVKCPYCDSIVPAAFNSKQVKKARSKDPSEWLSYGCEKCTQNFLVSSNVISKKRWVIPIESPSVRLTEVDPSPPPSSPIYPSYSVQNLSAVLGAKDVAEWLNNNRNKIAVVMAETSEKEWTSPNTRVGELDTCIFGTQEGNLLLRCAPLPKKKIKITCVYFSKQGKFYTQGEADFEEDIFRKENGNLPIYPREYGRILWDRGLLPEIADGRWMGPFTISVDNGKDDGTNYPELMSIIG